MGKHPTNIVDASRETVALPDCRSVALPGGRQVNVHRLNWLQFELLWTEVAALLALLAQDNSAEGDAQLAAQLASTPQFVLKLVQQSTGLGEQELAQWRYDDVLAVAAEAIRLNFTDSAGLRSFFLSASELAGLDGAAAATTEAGSTPPPSTS